MCKGTINNILKTQWTDSTYHAEGGNSYVFKAKDGEDSIAIKVFRRFTIENRYHRFLKEIKHMALFNTIEGIVPVLSSNETPPHKPINCEDLKSISDLAYFVMPYYKGNLKELLESIAIDDGTIAVETTVKISKIILKMHEKNYAHRDLKPENILFNDNEDFFISDLGLCIDLDDIPEPDQRLSGGLELIGSVTYRSPELLRGRLGSGDHRPCDIFSIGRILWSLIYGKEPDRLTDLEFEASSVCNCERKIKKPKVLDDIIRGATVNDPRSRMNIIELIDALSEWLKEYPKGSKDYIINKIIN